MRNSSQGEAAGPPRRGYEMCFGCGQDNPLGLHLTFEVDGEEVRSDWMSDERYQGYPGLLHGGILYSLLDEIMGQVVTLRRTWVMTGRLNVRYHAPTPIGHLIRLRAWIDKQRGRAFEISAEAALENGTKLASATGLFLKVPENLFRQVATGLAPAQTEASGPPGATSPT